VHWRGGRIGAFEERTEPALRDSGYRAWVLAVMGLAPANATIIDGPHNNAIAPGIDPQPEADELDPERPRMRTRPHLGDLRHRPHPPRRHLASLLSSSRSETVAGASRPMIPEQP
jgi:hypothetical protein